MGCSKILTLTGGCPLSTCLNQAGVYLTGGETNVGTNLYSREAFAADPCYCLVTGYDATYSNTFFYKYDAASNTLVQKATLASYVFYPMYDAAAKLFVTTYSSGGTVKVWTFNPLTETVAEYDTGGTVGFNPLLYIPAKGRLYGSAGADGLGQNYVAYLDMVTHQVVRLGVIPNAGGSHPWLFGMCYSPFKDALYGYNNAAGYTGIVKFDLATNTGSLPTGTGTITGMVYDSDRDFLLIAGGATNLGEVDLTTETVVNSYAPPANMWVGTGGCFVSTLSKGFFLGYNYDTNNDVLVSYNTTSTAFTFEFQSDYQYVAGPVSLGDQSAIVEISDIATYTKVGVRKLCLT